MYYESWNETSESFEQILTRPCTLQDFGIDMQPGDNAIFFGADLNKIDEFKRKIGIMQCNDQPVNFVGNWNTQTAQVLEFYFERCDSDERPSCKPDVEVKEWMKDKYLLLGYNRQLFQNDKFDDNRFQRISFLDWLPLDVNSQTMNRFNI